MSSLISCLNLEKSFGGPPLFKGISINVFDDERIGVLGPNGSGKSTLLKIIAGIETAEAGEITKRKGLRLAYLSQQEVFMPKQTIHDVMLEGLKPLHLPDEENWSRIGEISSLLGLDDLEKRIETLSGGWRKRVALAQQIVKAPDLLLLDEPTNHLDLEGIAWLEKFILQTKMAIVVVSHDRALLENTASRIYEINRIYPQGYFTTEGNYSKFLERRETFLDGLAKYEDSLRNKVRREIEWLRRGPKARTTKALGRIKQAEKLIGELKEYQGRSAAARTADIDFNGSSRRTKKLVELQGVEKSMGGNVLFSDVSLILSPGTRLGLVGANGSGKSTLLRVIEGSLPPDSGAVFHAPELKIVTFDQNRQQLNPEDSLRKSLSPDSDTVIYRDRPIHVASWASRFLFRSDQLQSPIRSLSGGEQARLLIAKLMLLPADVLLLDEPTNDLDIDTLQVLEESLDDFPGAVVLITHDRFMLDRVSNDLLGLGRGIEPKIFASYEQWQNFESQSEQVASDPQSPLISQEERRELVATERKIEKLEAEIAKMKAHLDTPEISQNLELLRTNYEHIQAKERELADLIDRWSELEGRNTAG